MPLSRLSGATPTRFGDFFSIQGAQLGQFDDERAGQHGPHAGNAAQQVVLGAPDLGFSEGLFQVVIDAFELLGEPSLRCLSMLVRTLLLRVE